MTDSSRKKVLVLTYYWPPSGGAGVQRWLKFTKYMRDFDFEPVIYTADDPEYPSIDESLFKDLPVNLTMLKTPVWEPYKLYKRFTLQKKGHRINAGFLNQEKKKGIAEKISVWIRGNWFIPDARKFWIKPSIRYLVNYLKENPVDLIASTGPPHSMHLIGLGVSQKMNIPWIADFRDPWTKIDFYQDLMLTRRADRKHRKLELSVLKNASHVTVNSHDMKRVFNEMGIEHVMVIPNGFDPEDFSDPEKTVEATRSELDTKFSFTHIGTIVPSRNPETLWKVFAELVRTNEDFARDLEIKLVGASDYSVSRSIQENDLDDWISNIDYLPHKEAIHLLKHTQVLLLLINNTPFAKGVQPGKLFEYMCADRPILAVGPPDGESALFLNETKTGHIVDFTDYNGMKNQILDYYNQYKNGNLKVEPDNIERYSRKTLTGTMTSLFNQILNST
ncbi:glycosyltransferase family 4 protein [Bacteroidota bacterium]